jgi:hypothetical protein
VNGKPVVRDSKCDVQKVLDRTNGFLLGAQLNHALEAHKSAKEAKENKTAADKKVCATLPL